MAFKGKNRIVSEHSFAVVGNPHQTPTAEFDVNLNAFRSRINRIFDEFFDDRSRTLDDLARRDLICQIVG